MSFANTFMQHMQAQNSLVPELKLRPEFGGADPYAATEAPPVEPEQSGFSEAEQMLAELREAVADRDTARAKRLIASSPIPLQTSMEPGVNSVRESQSYSVSGPRQPDVTSPANTGAAAADRSRPDDLDNLDFVLRDPQGNEIYRGSYAKERAERARAFRSTTDAEGGRLTGLARQAWDEAAEVVSTLGLPVHKAQETQVKLFDSIRNQLQGGANAERMAMSRAVTQERGGEKDQLDAWDKGKNTARQWLKESGAEKALQSTVGLKSSIDQFKSKENEGIPTDRRYVNMVQGALYQIINRGVMTDKDWVQARGEMGLWDKLQRNVFLQAGLPMTEHEIGSLINTLDRVVADQTAALENAYDGAVQQYSDQPDPNYKKGYKATIRSHFGRMGLYDDNDWGDDEQPRGAARGGRKTNSDGTPDPERLRLRDERLKKLGLGK